MYIPAHFAESSVPTLHGVMRQHPFATMIAATASGLEANHIPLVLDASPSQYGTLRGHIARANTLWQRLDAGSEVLAVFHGPHHYISPSWYPSKREHGRVVPTWNYVAVHARGRIEWCHDAAWLRRFVEALTTQHEAAEESPWHVTDAPEDYVQRMLGAIVGFEISIGELSGKWKLSQNRTPADRTGAVKALAERDADARAMATVMDAGLKSGDE